MVADAGLDDHRDRAAQLLVALFEDRVFSSMGTTSSASPQTCSSGTPALASGSRLSIGLPLKVVRLLASGRRPSGTFAQSPGRPGLCPCRRASS